MIHVIATIEVHAGKRGVPRRIPQAGAAGSRGSRLSRLRADARRCHRYRSAGSGAGERGHRRGALGQPRRAEGSPRGAAHGRLPSEGKGPRRGREFAGAATGVTGVHSKGCNHERTTRHPVREPARPSWRGRGRRRRHGAGIADVPGARRGRKSSRERPYQAVRRLLVLQLRRREVGHRHDVPHRQRAGLSVRRDRRSRTLERAQETRPDAAPSPPTACRAPRS